MDPDFPLIISVFGFRILAVALCNSWHSENSDLQRKKLGSLCIKKKDEKR
jgi:hypothetical protein